MLTKCNGETYSGSFYNHKYHGDGEYRYTEGSVYNGGWIAGFRHGHGVMRFQDGSIYDVSDFVLIIDLNSKW